RGKNGAGGRRGGGYVKRAGASAGQKTPEKAERDNTGPKAAVENMSPSGRAETYAFSGKVVLNVNAFNLCHGVYSQSLAKGYHLHRIGVAENCPWRKSPQFTRIAQSSRWP